MSCHAAANGGKVGVGDRAFIDELTTTDDKNAIGKFEQFVQVFADQKDSYTPVTGIDNLAVNKIDGGKIQTKARVRGDQQINVIGG
jgi:hypothetical protein